MLLQESSENDADTASSANRIRLRDFIVHENIGDGSVGTVYGATEKSTGDSVSLKYICSSTVRDRPYVQKQIDREVAAQSLLADHPNILALRASFADGVRGTVLVFDRAEGGDLMKKMEKNGPLPKETVQCVLRQMCSALEYCHARGVIHRDIKPENVLCNSDMSLFRLADFGHCTAALKKGEEQRLHWSYCGTLDYLSPDMIASNYGRGYDHRVDIWSCGVLVFELLSNDTPFYSESHSETCRRVRDINIRWPTGEKEKSATIDNVDARDLISAILVQREKRLSLQEILEHPFCKTN